MTLEINTNSLHLLLKPGMFVITRGKQGDWKVEVNSLLDNFHHYYRAKGFISEKEKGFTGLIQDRHYFSMLVNYNEKKILYLNRRFNLFNIDFLKENNCCLALFIAPMSSARIAMGDDLYDISSFIRVADSCAGYFNAFETFRQLV